MMILDSPQEDARRPYSKHKISVLKLVIVVGHQSWKNDERIMEKSWNLIPGKHWEPCPEDHRVAQFHQEPVED